MSELAGSVKHYLRHVLIFTGCRDWPPHIEEEGFPARVHQAAADLLKNDRKSVKITACDSPSRGEGHDLLVLPDRILYLSVAESDLEELVGRHFVEGRPANRLNWEEMPGRQVLVCIHGQRDNRCGSCGPPLLERLKQTLNAWSLSEPVQVYGTSHVGGHKYAGNVIFYPEGDWYGYVRPGDVPRLLRSQLIEGRILAGLWRGRLGLSTEEQIQTFRASLSQHPQGGSKEAE